MQVKTLLGHVCWGIKMQKEAQQKLNKKGETKQGKEMMKKKRHTMFPGRNTSSVETNLAIGSSCSFPGLPQHGIIVIQLASGKHNHYQDD